MLTLDAVFSDDDLLELDLEDIEASLAALAPPIWQPNVDIDGEPNPQRLAYESEADILGYGGAAGGGKTDLLLGLAATQHQRSAIFRRIFPSLRGIIERSREIFNPSDRPRGKDSYNETLHRWLLESGRQIELEACQYEKDKEKQRGRPRDFYGFDEVTEFTRSQVEFISAWNRTTDPNQRCRIVMTFNPPTDDAGGWVVDYFKPWFAHLYPDSFTHDNPAKPGELRWYATVEGKEIELPDGEPFKHEGDTIHPRSRTFIPARLEHNPYLADTGYGSVLQSLPEPLRSQLLKGDFSAAADANPWQVIPTAWVKAAQRRWIEQEKPNDTPLSAVGIDPARGGQDKTVISKRYGVYFDELVARLGVETPDGPAVAAVTHQAVGGEKPGYINVDVIGIGSAAYDTLKVMFSRVNPINASEGSTYRDKTGRLKMRNRRAEYYWRFREALDPISGDGLALPADNELVADLCAATYKVTAAGVQIEEKDKIKERIGRSPDRGEALMLAYYGSHYSPLIASEGTHTASTWGAVGGLSTNGSRWRR